MFAEVMGFGTIMKSHTHFFFPHPQLHVCGLYKHHLIPPNSSLSQTFFILYWQIIKLNMLLFLSLKDEQKLFRSLRSRLKDDIFEGKDLSLHFLPSGQTIPLTTEMMLPIITGVEDDQAISFDWTTYQEHLQTKVLGHVVFYTDVITSTQTVFDG